MVYMFTLNRNRSRLRDASARAGRCAPGEGGDARAHSVWTSVARPAIPRYTRSVTGNTWGAPHGAPRELGPDRPPQSAHLFKVRRDRQRLVPETQVRGDCDAVLARHGHHTPAVVFHYRLSRDTVSQPKYQGAYSAVVCTMMGESRKFVGDDRGGTSSGYAAFAFAPGCERTLDSAYAEAKNQYCAVTPFDLLA